MECHFWQTRMAEDLLNFSSIHLRIIKYNYFHVSPNDSRNVNLIIYACFVSILSRWEINRIQMANLWQRGFPFRAAFEPQKTIKFSTSNPADVCKWKTEICQAKKSFLFNVARLSATLHHKLNRNLRFWCIWELFENELCCGRYLIAASDLVIYHSLQTTRLSSWLNVRLASECMQIHFKIVRPELDQLISPKNNEFHSWLRHQLSFHSLSLLVLFIQLRTHRKINIYKHFH